MLSPEQFFAFLAASVLITATPGPDNLMVMGLGISRGARPGMAFGLGCATGCISHTLLATLGVSAVLAASPLAFTLLKIAGGVYLCILGWRALKSRGGLGPVTASPATETVGRLFARGLLANAINPKVMLFFLSFLPQFIEPAKGQVAMQTAALGMVFAVQAAVLFCLLAAFAGRISQRLQRSPRASLWLDRITGALFIALGVRLVLAR